MPNAHPAAVAASIAMLDHMLDGRLIFGISPGGSALGRGSVRQSRGRQECNVPGGDQPGASDLGRASRRIIFTGKYWNISVQKTLIEDIGQGFIPRPLQRPHPPIVVTAVAPFSKGVTEAAARGWDPISANFLMPAWVKSHWPKYVEGCERAGRAADTANWRVAKSVFVAKDAATAKAYATDPNGPYVYYYRSLFTKLKKQRPDRVVQNASRPARRRSDAGIDLRQAHHSRHAGERCRPAPCFSGRDRPLRYAALCRQGLEGSRAWAPVDDPDGRKGDAACQCRRRPAISRPRNSRLTRKLPWHSAIASPIKLKSTGRS